VQVADGVYQFKVPMPANPAVPDGRLRYTLAYAAQTPSGWVMVDVGLDSDEGFMSLQEQMSNAGITPRDISLIVVTHGHRDHVGLAPRLRKLSGAQVAMHKLDASNPYVLAFQPGTRPPHIDVFPDGGKEVLPGSGLLAIWTPGHTPGHICLYDMRRRLLFSGDHLLPITTPNVSLYPGDESNPLKSFLEGHRRLKELDVAMVLPAHEHTFANLGDRVEQIIAHHMKRTQEIMDHVRDRPKTSWEIASAIKWNAAPWKQLNSVSRQAALWETMAHVQYLLSEGQLIKHEEGSHVLVEELRRVLDARTEHRVALIGVGRLGRATLSQISTASDSFKVVAAFDADPRQIGQVVSGISVQPMERLTEALKGTDTSAAIVAVPAPYVQGVVDRLIACNVQTIVNYAPIRVRVPPQIQLHEIDAVLALQSMTYYGLALL